MDTSHVSKKASDVLKRCNVKIQQLGVSSKPLKFRSFDQFYQYHSQKQQQLALGIHSNPNSARLKATVRKKTGEFQPSDKIPNKGNEDLVIQHTDIDNEVPCNELLASTDAIYQCQMLKGRVKLLCKIFQKAHNDGAYKSNLEQSIYKNKVLKTSARSKGRGQMFMPKTPRVYNLSQLDEELDIDLTDEFAEYAMDSQIPKEGTDYSFSKFPMIYNVGDRGVKTFDEFTECTSIKDPDDGDFDDITDDDYTVRYLAQDVLYRFLNEEDFCTKFPMLIKDISVSLFSESDVTLFTKVINEIQDLIDSKIEEDINQEEIDSMQDADFDWFFCSQNAIEFTLDSRTNTTVGDDTQREHGSDDAKPKQRENLVPEPLRSDEHMERFKWVNND